MIFGRVAQEVDHLGQLTLGLFLASDIGKGYLGSLRIVLSRAAAAEPEDVLLAARHLPAHEEDQSEEKQNGQETDQQPGPERARLLLAIHHHILGGELIHQLLIVGLDNRRDRCLELVGFDRAGTTGGFDRLIGLVPVNCLFEIDLDRRIRNRRFFDVACVDLSGHD